MYTVQQKQKLKFKFFRSKEKSAELKRVMEDTKSFLLSSFLGPVPLATTTDTATMAPPFLHSSS
jgi:hypothetical protein